MNSMIYRRGRDERVFVTCEACRNDCSVGETARNEEIEEFYSDIQAIDNGWRRTEHIKFCPPDKECVWICPECWPGDTK